LGDLSLVVHQDEEAEQQLRRELSPACLLELWGCGSVEPGLGKEAESQQLGSCQVRECVTEQLLDMQ